jgi:hypothetical protein
MTGLVQLTRGTRGRSTAVGARKAPVVITAAAPVLVTAPPAALPQLAPSTPPSGPRARSGRGRPRLVLLGEDPSRDELREARRTARKDLPAPAAVMRSFAMALLEVEAGCRSAAQLERRCRPPVWEELNARLRRSGGAFVTGASILSVHCQELEPGLADGVAVVRRDDRVAAMAMRLDARNGQWIVTELCL